MAAAAVSFVRGAEKVHIALTVGGTVVAESTSISFIARAIAAHGISTLALTPTYSIALPTTAAILTEAAEQQLDEPLTVFILISECAW